MADLIALSFDVEASPSASVREGPSGPLAWGLAWYPDDGRAAIAVHGQATGAEAAAAGGAPLGDGRGEARRRRSSLVVARVGEVRPGSARDEGPVVLSYAGREWALAYDGEPGQVLALPPAGVPLVEPASPSSRGHALAWLLARVMLDGARTLEALDVGRLQGLLGELDAQGAGNLVLTDGETLALYRSRWSLAPLSWRRHLPPDPPPVIETPLARVRLDSPLDRYRVVLAGASRPEGEGWRELVPGAVLRARRGQIHDAEPVGARRAPGAPPRRGAPPPEPGERLLAVVHETAYRYDGPVERSSHRLRLRPCHDRGQEVIEHSLTLSAPADLVEFEDVFGNAAMAAEVDRPFTELLVRARSLVRVTAACDPRPADPAAEPRLPLVWMPWQRQMLLPYLLPPELPETQLRELTDYALSFVRRNDAATFATLWDVNASIHSEFSYVSGSTTLETTAFEVYAARRGVCQDFANLLICLARLLGVPARYRVGYIHTGATHENRIQSEASHAWTELYLPWLGWVGLDPTNGCLAGLDHVRVACGRSYRDATPTEGTTWRGGVGERLEVRVEVTPVEVEAPVEAARPDAPPSPLGASRYAPRR